MNASVRYEPAFLSSNELQFLQEFLAVLLPSEEGSPGADELQIAEFIDSLLAVSPTEQGSQWKFGIAAINELSLEVYGKKYSCLDEAQRHKLMEHLYTKKIPRHGSACQFAADAKALAIKAYYRTEHGIHTELNIPKPSYKVPGAKSPLVLEADSELAGEYDVVVVGSGATGGWAAKELTEAGFSVLVLESGAALDENDYLRNTRYPYELPFRNMLDASWQFRKRQPIQSKIWACDEYSQKFFVEDADSPYETSLNSDFTWIQGSRLGGRMNVWGRQVYRYSDVDFKAASIDGVGKNWPIGYGDLEAFYDEIEEYIGVSGSPEGLAHLPDGNFLPPMNLTDGEELLKERVEARWPGRKVIIGRTATLTVPHRGRAACHYCGSCYRGCVTSSFFNSVNHTLADAAMTGNLAIRTDSLVTKVLVDQESKRASEVEYIDKRTGRTHTIRARSVVLAASTIGSTRILLNSRSSAFPKGIGGSSNALGNYLHGHIHSVSVIGTVPELMKSPGTHDEGRPNQIYIPRYTNLSEREDLPFVRGYGIEGAVKHYMVPRDVGFRPGFGVDLKESIRSNPTPARFFLTAFGTMLPRHDNNVLLSGHTDRWGVPTVSIDCTYGENDLLMAAHMAESLKEISEAADFVITSVNTEPGTPGQCIHEAGTARMGTDPSDSVLDQFNRTWDVENVVVVDGSCFVSSGPQNPTLTMMALALRASRKLADDLKKRDGNDSRLAA